MSKKPDLNIYFDKQDIQMADTHTKRRSTSVISRKCKPNHNEAAPHAH